MAEKLDSDSFRKLLNKVNAKTSSRLAKGNACSRCKERKSKCDGQRPCKSCARMGLSCDATQPNCSSGATPAQAAIPSVADFFQSPEERMIAMQRMRPLKVEWPVPSPPSYTYFTRKYPLQLRLPLECLPLCFFNLGIRDREMLDMVSAMPEELRLALRRLGNRLQLLKNPYRPPSWLPAIPQAVEMSDNSRTFRTVHRFNDTLETTSFECNSLFADMSGAHPEELAARTAQDDMPLMFSQWRFLTYQLHFLLIGTQVLSSIQTLGSMITGKPTQHDIVLCVAPRHVLHERDPRATARLSTNFHRVIVQGYRDGFSTMAVALSSDEYDEHVRANPQSKSAFVDCERGGAELAGAELMEEERLSSMGRSLLGRTRLLRLAHKINALFHLQDPVISFFENIFLPLPHDALALPHAPPGAPAPYTAEAASASLSHLSLNPTPRSGHALQHRESVSASEPGSRRQQCHSPPAPWSEEAAAPLAAAFAPPSDAAPARAATMAEESSSPTASRDLDLALSPTLFMSPSPSRVASPLDFGLA